MLLSTDDGPFPEPVPIMDSDGNPTEETTIELPDEDNIPRNPDTKSKLVIYIEFTKLLDLFVQVRSLFIVSSSFSDIVQGLRYEGIEPLLLTGSSSVKKRSEALRDFKDKKKNHRVLILSSIGGAGLNLHEARFMIFAVGVLFITFSSLIIFIGQRLV